MLFEDRDLSKVNDFVQELRKLALSVEGLASDYDRLIAVQDISYLFRIYLKRCTQNLHKQAMEETKSSIIANRYVQFFETELNTVPRMVFIFQKAYGTRFVRNLYQATYLAFIERQEQAYAFLKKCLPEHEKFNFFRKSVATIEESKLIEEPKIITPRITGQPSPRLVGSKPHEARRLDQAGFPSDLSEWKWDEEGESFEPGSIQEFPKKKGHKGLKNLLRRAAEED